MSEGMRYFSSFRQCMLTNYCERFSISLTAATGPRIAVLYFLSRVADRHMTALDLDSISRSVTKLRAVIPEDAFTAGILGSQRVGNGVVIDSAGLILTIGYLITGGTPVCVSGAPGRGGAG